MAELVKDECQCGQTVYYFATDSPAISVIYDDEICGIEHECEGECEEVEG